MTNAQFISRMQGCVARGGKQEDLWKHYADAGYVHSGMALMRTHIGTIVLGDIQPNEKDEAALTAWERQIHGTGG